MILDHMTEVLCMYEYCCMAHYIDVGEELPPPTVTEVETLPLVPLDNRGIVHVHIDVVAHQGEVTHKGYPHFQVASPQRPSLLG